MVGDPVNFTAVVDTPPGSGTVVSAEWDFDGSGEYEFKKEYDDTAAAMSRLILKTTYSFPEPGTYFPALRVSSHFHGDCKSEHCRLQNIGRVRVVVR